MSGAQERFIAPGSSIPGAATRLPRRGIPASPLRRANRLADATIRSRIIANSKQDRHPVGHAGSTLFQEENDNA